jgi:hypothetical protein
MASTQLRSGSLQTTVTDTGVGNILDGRVTGLDVLGPTEKNEKTSLLEADDEFEVVLSWELTGNSTPVIGGSWIVALYSVDIDGQGLMRGLIAGPDIVPIIGGTSPLKFEHRFTVSPPRPQLGLYQLTAVINHSPTGDPKRLSEMFGYAESTPIMINKAVVETS